MVVLACIDLERQFTLLTNRYGTEFGRATNPKGYVSVVDMKTRTFCDVAVEPRMAHQPEHAR